MIKTALSLLTTESSWDDLLLTKKALQQIKAISNQVKNNTTLTGKTKLINKTNKVSPVLFYGSQANEQITTAALIGKIINKDAYRIDLSKLVSKYIGETEKNLNVLFDTAEKKDWILFFEEADALFGKRSDVTDTHNRYANLDVTYLLQRIEDHPGLVLLAANKKTTIDPDFIKRLRPIIHFPKPKKKRG
jgi:SpoVK/Ycf46/Vps4 family AAA+-type ATPase